MSHHMIIYNLTPKQTLFMPTSFLYLAVLSLLTKIYVNSVLAV